jgi:hypothetical protein
MEGVMGVESLQGTRVLYIGGDFGFLKNRMGTIPHLSELFAPPRPNEIPIRFDEYYSYSDSEEGLDFHTMGEHDFVVIQRKRKWRV